MTTGSGINWDDEDIEQDESSLSQEVVDTVRLQIYNNNEFKLIETDTRNVLLVGRTRSGKSTTMEVLKDPCYIPKSDTIFSETVDARFKSFSIQNETNQRTCDVTLNLIDTPGLFEVKDIESGGERTNEVIAQTIAKCLDNEITNIHVIMLFVTFEAGINPNDIKAMEIFLDMFGGGGVKICLCITHADNHDVKWQRTRKEELHKFEATKRLIETENMEILFMGCVGSTHNIHTEDELLKQYKKVYLMRRKMLQCIFDASARVQLSTLNVAKQKVDEVRAVLRDSIPVLQKLASCSDENNSEPQKYSIEQKIRNEKLNAERAILSVPELAEEYSQFISKLKAVADNRNLSNEFRSATVWPFNVKVV